MPRMARAEYVGALYHVMDRGDRQEVIYRDAEDRRLFLKTLGQACERTGWRVHSYVLMSNHYHLLLETPEANLCAGMLQNEWISRRLEMGAAPRVSRYCSDAEGRAEVRRLMRKIEMAIGKD